jgi:5'-methylthioadenosine phosphorylase
MKLGVVLRAENLIRDKMLKPTRVVTPYGPVDRIFSGSLHDVETHFLYGRFPGLRTPSWEIPYEANQSAFDELGVDHLIGTFVVGGVDKSVRGGDLIIPHDLLSLSGPHRSLPSANGRFSNAHVIPSFCPKLRMLLIRGARHAGIAVHESGVYFSFYGFARVETDAELNLAERLGASLVGQTLDPEFTLARLRHRHYAAIAVAIDSYHDMKHEQEQDPEEFRARSRQAIADGRARFERIIEAGLATRDEEQEEDCGCAKTAKGKHREMFSSFPEELW